jgi:cell wall assembly regulator SMI1
LKTIHQRAARGGAIAAACVTLFLTGCGSATHHSESGDDLSSAPPPVVVTPPSDPPMLPPADSGGSPPTTPPTDPPTTPPAVTQVTVSGVVTFDRVPFKATAGAGLDFASTTHAPVRGATVEAIASMGGMVLATAKTSDTGTYSLTVPVRRQIFLRVKAEIVKAGTPAWNVRVRDNTSGGALYALDTSAFDSGSVATLARDINAPSGWSTTSGSYASPRSAAPFALLDVAYQSMQLVLSADANAVFPNLVFYWSPANVPVDGNISLGEIYTTFFEPGVASTPAAIYVLGEEDVDTDEYDRHVIAHEWGHYYQWAFGRDDSIGGDHDPFEKLDLRVAFSEGWGDGFSGMALADPKYRDSYDAEQATDFGVNLESTGVPNRGWYSEGSVAKLVYDLFDGGAGDDDAVQTGFGPLHAAIQSLTSTHALTGIHPFLKSVRAALPAQQAAIDTLANGQRIIAAADEFGVGETNSGGGTIALPIYTVIAPGQTKNVCSTGAPGETYNKLGNSSFLRFTLSASYTGTLSVSDPDVDADADVVLYRNGTEIGRSEEFGDESMPITLSAGTYVLETYDSSNIYGDDFGIPPIGDTCIDVSLTP